MKKWTIIIRTQGMRSDTLTEALYSVVVQNYNNKSVIVVLHSRNEEKQNKLRILLDRFKQYYEIELYVASAGEKRGHPLNVGLDRVEAEYVSFLDDDDILYPHAGKLLINSMEESKGNFACGKAIALQQRYVGRHGLEHYKNVGKHIFYDKELNPAELISTNYIPIHGYIYRFADFAKIRFDERLSLLEDWDFLLQMIFSRKLKASYVDYEVCEYRMRGDQTQSFQMHSDEVLNRNRKIISKKFKDQKFEMSYADAFKIYPDVNNMAGIPEEESVVGELRKRLECSNIRLQRIVGRKSFRIYNKMMKIFGRPVY